MNDFPSRSVEKRVRIQRGEWPSQDKHPSPDAVAEACELVNAWLQRHHFADPEVGRAVRTVLTALVETQGHLRSLLDKSTKAGLLFGEISGARDCVDYFGSLGEVGKEYVEHWWRCLDCSAHESHLDDQPQGLREHKPDCPYALADAASKEGEYEQPMRRV